MREPMDMGVNPNPHNKPLPNAELIPQPPIPPPPSTILPNLAEDVRLKRLALELARRRVEALKLYDALPEQQRFHNSRARIRIVRGSNRGGKTLAAAVEIARISTGQHPWLNRNGGVILCVGKDGKHIARTMWPKLSRAGAFKIIKDEVTGQWRAYRPWEESDLKRSAEVKRAPPLIPPRLIESVAWENKKEGLPSIVRLKNGWELQFYSSLGKPPQGLDADVWWFDEEIVDEEWLPEVSARMLDRHGCGIWSATPQAGTEHLYDLHEEAEAQHGEPEPTVEEFHILLANNPHIDEKEKRLFAATLKSDTERMVRVEGEFALNFYRVFPEYSQDVHWCDYFAIPLEWTRYAAIDPGRQVCAVVFLAIPPPKDEKHGHRIYVYDELYIKNCTAERFGQEMEVKAAHQTFQAFLIDHQAGRVHDMGSGKNTEQQYRDALRKHKVKCIDTGYGFTWGSTDIDGRIEALRGWMNIREDGTARLQMLGGKVKNLDWELKRFHNRVTNSVVTDKPVMKNNHAIDALCYLAAYRPKYVSAPKQELMQSGAYKAFMREQKEARLKNGAEFVRLGPSKH